MSSPSSTAALFGAFDRNQDGRLNFEDLRQGFADSGYTISNDDLKDLMQRFDQVRPITPPLKKSFNLSNSLSSSASV
jgi:Ca2+-binding EF-hand superfamily protein